MSVTVLVTQARSSFPGGRPLVTPARFLVSSFQFRLDIFSSFRILSVRRVQYCRPGCASGEHHAKLAVFNRLAAALGLRLLSKQLIKHKVHEAFQRSVALLSLRTQQRPLPAVEQEARQ